MSIVFKLFGSGISISDQGGISSFKDKLDSQNKLNSGVEINKDPYTYALPCIKSDLLEQIDNDLISGNRVLNITGYTGLTGSLRIAIGVCQLAISTFMKLSSDPRDGYIEHFRSQGSLNLCRGLIELSLIGGVALIGYDLYTKGMPKILKKESNISGEVDQCMTEAKSVVNGLLGIVSLVRDVVSYYSDSAENFSPIRV